MVLARNAWFLPSLGKYGNVRGAQESLSTYIRKYSDVFSVAPNAVCLVDLASGGLSLMPRQSPFSVVLSKDERQHLESIARQYTSPYRDVIRAKIVLLASQGLSNDVIASRLDTPRQIVSKWRKRFCLARLPGLEDEPRGGRQARFSPQSRRAGKSSRL
jgi:hypothetical protein